MPEDVVDDALLVVTRLIANVDHALTPFRLVVQRAGAVLPISVTDDSVRLPVLRQFDPRARRGRGLQVIAGVAREWSWDEYEGGKVV